MYEESDINSKRHEPNINESKFVCNFVREDIKEMMSKIRRGPKLEGCAFTNFGNSSGTEEESRVSAQRHTYAHNLKGILKSRQIGTFTVETSF